MTLAELQNKLAENNVPRNRYSINEGMKLDALNLYIHKDKWNFAYLDERGQVGIVASFKNENEAYGFLWEKLKSDLVVFRHRTNVVLKPKLEALRKKLDDNEIPKNRYSLNDGLKLDAVNLYRNIYNRKWTCVYVSKRLEFHDMKEFETDNEAFDYLWKLMEEELFKKD